MESKKGKYPWLRFRFPRPSRIHWQDESIFARLAELTWPSTTVPGHVCIESIGALVATWQSL